MKKELCETAEFLKKRLPSVPETFVILGSGLGTFGEQLDNLYSMDYSEIPGFVRSTADSHKGKLLYGTIGKKPVLLMQGRFHYYEGYSLDQVVYPVRVMAMMGVRNMVVTNAAGGINPTYSVGDFMLIKDHLKLTGISPLRGTEVLELGDRFVNMTGAYDEEFRRIAKESAHRLGITLQEGVYALMAGPQFETPAEIRMLNLLGGDAVGMSTVPEVIAARQMGLRVLGISCITNAAAKEGIDVSGEEVIETTERIKDTFHLLMKEILGDLS